MSDLAIDPPSPAERRPRLSRRRWLQASIASAAAVNFYTWQIEPHWVETIERPLPIRNLPSRWENRRIVQLSDLHIGDRVRDDYLLECFRRVQAFDPDLVLFTGDFITHHRKILEQTAAIFRHLPHGRFGSLAILGNHDYANHFRDADVAAIICRQAARNDVRVLRNEATVIDDLHLIGFDDLWCGRFDLRLLQHWDRQRPAIAMSHNPDTVDLNGWEPFRGWVLSGHTHGGQCKPPWLPPPALPVRNRRYTRGEFALTGNRRMYINAGLGHALQVRFNVRPEITLFTLVPETDAA